MRQEIPAPARHLVRAKPGRNRPTTYRLTSHVTLPDAAWDRQSRIDYPEIAPGSLVVIGGALDQADRLGNAMGHAIDCGAGAIAVQSPAADGIASVVVWSALPNYTIGSTVGLDLIV